MHPGSKVRQATQPSARLQAVQKVSNQAAVLPLLSTSLSGASVVLLSEDGSKRRLHS